jgi:hypothetical protein
VGGVHQGEIADHYATNWVGLPTSGQYPVALQSSADTSGLQLSVVARVGTQLVVTPVPAAPGGFTLDYSVPTGAEEVTAVLTNTATASAGQPVQCGATPYTLMAGAATPAAALGGTQGGLAALSPLEARGAQALPPFDLGGPDLRRPGRCWLSGLLGLDELPMG